MSDLIDFTSPENKKVRPPKLTSPLIPVPKDDVESNKADAMAVPTRKSLNDNPFDVVLQKTNEYIRKCQDPFEMAFEKAINNTHTSEPKLSATSKDDYCYKRIRHPDTVKMNKTFTDNPSPKCYNILNNQSSSLSHWKNYAITDLAHTLSHEVLQKNSIIENSSILDKKATPLISIDAPTPNLDLSILNQSVLNNTFSDEYCTGRQSIGKFLNKTTVPSIAETSILNQSAMNDSLSGSGSSDDGLIKSIVNHRIDSCIKQALEKSEINSGTLTDQYHQLRRSLSQGDVIAIGNSRKMLSPSVTGSKNLSTFNDKSLSSILHEDDFNHGFLKSSSVRFSTTSEISSISTISAISRLNSASNYTASFEDSTNPINNAFIKSCLSLTSETPQKKQNSLSTDSRIRSTNSLTKISNLADQFNILKLKSNNFYSEGTSISDQEKCNISNDSVFAENIQTHKTLNHDMLEQSKLQTSNSSIGEDLLPKKLPNDLDLSLESEIHVDNLIELHTSNSFNKTESNSFENNQSSSHKREDVKIDTVKELEQELIEPEKKPVAATLLMELQKLIKIKDNPKAVELLKNLGEYLGVKCHSNVELLEIYFQNANELNEHIDINKADQISSKVKKTEVNISEEDNVSIELENSLTKKDKMSNIEHNLDKNEEINKGNKALTINGEVQRDEKKSENSFGTQKLIMDIQLALRQLLTDYNGEPTSFLENLKKVINPIPNEEITEKIKIKKTMSNRVSLSPKKSSGLVNRSLKSPLRQSFGSNSTKKPSLIKRRASMSQIPEIDNRNVEGKLRADSPKKEIKKRISSYGESPLEKNKVKIESQPIKIKSSVPVFNKTKLKKKSEVDAPVKKGPLKAVIPLGSMQRKTTVGMKVSIVVEPTTPPKSSHHISSIKRISTPIREPRSSLDLMKKSKKTKPVASSTPELASKSLNIKETVPPSPRHNMSWNISPVTPTPPRSLNSSNINKISSIKRVQSNKVLVPSPKARNVTPRRLEQTSEIPKHSNVLNNSLKNSSNKINHSRYSEPLKKVGINKSVSVEKTQKSIQSPLKEKNSPTLKNKSTTSVSKLHRHSASITSTEKENKTKK